MENFLPKIAILLASFNGEKYILEQLNSINKQDETNWFLWISDDGSTDKTREICENYIADQQINGCFLEGPKKGLCHNFMSLIQHPKVDADYFAFADQDDIWFEDKLSKATKWLATIPDHIPALFCSRTQLIDENKDNIGLSVLNKKPPGFGNALIQNIASGNTMVFNKAAKIILEQVDPAALVIHDWALYQLVTGCNGIVFYDKQPTVYYRQHSHNQIGAKNSFFNRLSRFFQAHRNNTVQQWNQKTTMLLSHFLSQLTPIAKAQFIAFSKIHGNSIYLRFHFLKKARLYHQQTLGYIALLTYILFNKF